jgi:hypothetical protein
MTTGILKTGPDSLEEETLTENERYAVDMMCRQVLEAWQAEGQPCDHVELLMLLNGGAARAVKMVRDKGLG